MTFYSAVVSLIIGCLIGMVYGLSFLAMKARPLYQGTSKLSMWQVTIPSVVRIALFAYILFYILHILFLDSILVLVPFLLTFWLTVLTHKNYYD